MDDQGDGRADAVVGGDFFRDAVANSSSALLAIDGEDIIDRKSVV